MQNSEKMSISYIFSALGGTSAVARALNVGSSTASEMKRRGRIPAEYWRDLLTAARATGHSEITADLMVELHARKSPDGDIRGLGEQETPALTPLDPTYELRSNASEGQFSRWKHLRRSHFASQEEIEDHIRALRDEWDRR